MHFALCTNTYMMVVYAMHAYCHVRVLKLVLLLYNALIYFVNMSCIMWAHVILFV
jgi:hypothetical protein